MHFHKNKLILTKKKPIFWESPFTLPKTTGVKTTIFISLCNCVMAIHNITIFAFEYLFTCFIDSTKPYLIETEIVHLPSNTNISPLRFSLLGCTLPYFFASLFVCFFLSLHFTFSLYKFLNFFLSFSHLFSLSAYLFSFLF